ncbi:MAG: metallophosphoesterase [Bacteroidota bacterium]
MPNSFFSSAEFGLSYALHRREFLKLSTLYSSSLLFAPSLLCTPSEKSIRFGLLADSHYADRDPWKTRYYRQSIDKTREAVSIMNQEKVDFLIHLGDFKDEGPEPNATQTLSFLADIEAELQKFEGPVFHCLGNHDVDSITKKQYLQAVQNTGIGKEKSYFSFDLKGYHCIVLDANYHKDGRDQFYAEGADWQDPNIPQEELEWLKADLAKTDKPCIIFCHHPLFEFRRNNHQYHVNNYQEVQEILEASKKVMIVFQGHVHAEEYKEIKGIHYLTLLAMVDYEGLENNSYSIAEIKGSQIRIDGFRRAADRKID